MTSLTIDKPKTPTPILNIVQPELLILEDFASVNGLDIAVENGEVKLSPKGICKHCHVKGCCNRYLKLIGKSISVLCDNRPGHTRIFTILTDPNILKTIGRDKITALMSDHTRFIEYCSGTDYATVRLLVRAMGTLMRKKGSNFFIYNGSTCLWEKYDADSLPYVLAKYARVIVQHMINVNKTLMEDPAMADHLDKAKVYDARLFKLLSKLESRPYTVRIAKTILTSGEVQEIELDSGHPDYLPISGRKVINLKTGEVSERQDFHYFQFELDVNYLGRDHPSPHMTEFMLSILGGNKEKLECLQQVMGYWLSGDTSYTGLNIFIGDGANGKTALVNVVNSILGEFQTTLMPCALMKNNSSSSATPALMPLLGTRFASIAETEVGEKINNSLAKLLTGGDKISARDIFSKPIEFYNTAKLCLLTNNAPDFETSYAELRRIKIFKLHQRFVEGEEYEKHKNDPFVSLLNRSVEKNLKTIYKDDAFTFLVNGCIDHFRNGAVKIPKGFKKDMNEYVDDNDYMAQFIQEMCDVDPSFEVRSSVLLSYYKDWANERNVGHKANPKTLKGELVKKKFKYRRGKYSMVQGLKLKPIEEDMVQI